MPLEVLVGLEDAFAKVPVSLGAWDKRDYGAVDDVEAGGPKILAHLEVEVADIGIILIELLHCHCKHKPSLRTGCEGCLFWVDFDGDAFG